MYPNTNTISIASEELPIEESESVHHNGSQNIRQEDEDHHDYVGHHFNLNMNDVNNININNSTVNWL